MFTNRNEKAVWSKVLIQDEAGPNDIFSDPKHAAVLCVRETSGYAIWYARNLASDDPHGLPGVENGFYLLKFFGHDSSNEAIEYAVRCALSDEDPLKAVHILERRTSTAMKLV